MRSWILLACNWFPRGQGQLKSCPIWIWRLCFPGPMLPPFYHVAMDHPLAPLIVCVLLHNSPVTLTTQFSDSFPTGSFSLEAFHVAVPETRANISSVQVQCEWCGRNVTIFHKGHRRRVMLYFHLHDCQSNPINLLLDLQITITQPASSSMWIHLTSQTVSFSVNSDILMRHARVDLLRGVQAANLTFIQTLDHAVPLSGRYSAVMHCCHCRCAGRPSS